MKTITMLQLRQNSELFIRRLREGQRMLLTYRGKPVAHVEPIPKKKARAEDEPLFGIHRLAEVSPLGALNHDEIDALLLGK